MVVVRRRFDGRERVGGSVGGERRRATKGRDAEALFRQALLTSMKWKE
jgi:hypothetical protein